MARISPVSMPPSELDPEGHGRPPTLGFSSLPTPPRNDFKKQVGRIWFFGIALGQSHYIYGERAMVDSNLQNKHQGGCLCGKVRFAVHGEIGDVVNCHCMKCRRFHGNYGAYTRVKVESLELTDDKCLKWYKSSADETPNVHRGFCSECGSSLFWHAKDQTNISIAAGALDSPTNLKTIGHIWCNQIADFYTIEDDLPRFDKEWGT